MPDFDREQKTEEATPRRREELRKQGQVARSSELNSALILFLGALLLRFAGPHAAEGMKSVLADCLGTWMRRPITRLAAQPSRYSSTSETSAASSDWNRESVSESASAGDTRRSPAANALIHGLPSRDSSVSRKSNTSHVTHSGAAVITPISR